MYKSFYTTDIPPTMEEVYVGPRGINPQTYEHQQVVYLAYTSQLNMVYILLMQNIHLTTSNSWDNYIIYNN